MPDKNFHSTNKNRTNTELVEVYFKKHYSELCRGVYRLLPDQALAEDLVQEVFIRVWERKEQINFNDRFIFYLKRSCHHAALAYLASKPFKLNTETSIELSDNTSSDQAIEQAQLENEVRRAINALPEKTKLTFTLSRFEEMTYKEIALELSISVKSVEKHMTIALKRLREALNNHLISIWVLIFWIRF